MKGMGRYWASEEKTMNRGKELIDAIKRNLKLQAVDDCPGVPVHIGTAVYGVAQEDSNGVAMTKESTDKEWFSLLWFNGSQAETAVWHFYTLPTLHHFVVIPWYNQDPPGRSYTVFMAYENQYTLKNYIDKAPGWMGNYALEKGFEDERTYGDIMAMMKGVLKNEGAWQAYFSSRKNLPVDTIMCFKYPKISLADAIGNVAAYV
jgi:hypothetical protein